MSGVIYVDGQDFRCVGVRERGRVSFAIFLDRAAFRFGGFFTWINRMDRILDIRDSGFLGFAGILGTELQRRPGLLARLVRLSVGFAFLTAIPADYQKGA